MQHREFKVNSKKEERLKELVNTIKEAFISSLSDTKSVTYIGINML